MSVNVVILAAGQGKRMQSALPKVLHLLAGRPLLAHVLACARALKPARTCVVYGHGGDADGLDDPLRRGFVDAFREGGHPGVSGDDDQQQGRAHEEQCDDPVEGGEQPEEEFHGANDRVRRCESSAGSRVKRER